MLLERYYQTKLSLKYTSITRWMEADEFLLSCQKQQIPPLVRLFLLSDGSLVKFLKALYLSDITVDVKSQSQAKMGVEMAKYLDSAERVDSIVRDVWLCCKERRIVYAHSLIDASKMGDMIGEGINKKNTPVGRILSDYSVPLLRDQLFISQIKSDQLKEDFSVAENIFWARYYRLRGGDGFNSAIIEIFSPDLFVSRN